LDILRRYAKRCIDVKEDFCSIGIISQTIYIRIFCEHVATINWNFVFVKIRKNILEKIEYFILRDFSNEIFLGGMLPFFDWPIKTAISR
jgi:hypothetical protein